MDPEEVSSCTSFSGDVVVDILPIYDWDNSGFGVAFANVRSIGGDLVVTAFYDQVALAFPQLLSVAGSVNLQAWNMYDFQAPVLQVVNTLVFKECDDIAVFSLPALQVVNDRIYIQSNYMLTSVSLPALVSFWTMFVSSNMYLTSLVFPALKTAGGIDLRGSQYFLTSISLPELVSLDDGLWLQNAGGLLSFSAPKLQRIGSPLSNSPDHFADGLGGFQLYLQNLPLLNTLWLPQLAELLCCTSCSPGCQGLSIGSLAALTKIEFPVLTRHDGYFTLMDSNQVLSLSLPSLTEMKMGLTMHSCTALQSISLPSLRSVGGDLQLEFADSLTSVDLSSLRTVHYINFWYLGTLRRVVLPRLQTAAGFSVQNFDVAYVSAPQLRTITASDLSLHSSGLLSSIYFPVLESVAQRLFLSNSPLLTSVEFPRLHTASPAITLTSLTFLSLPALRSATGLFIELEATALTSFEFPNLTLADPSKINKLTVPSMCCDAVAALLGRLGSTLAAYSCSESVTCYCPLVSLLADPHAVLAASTNSTPGGPAQNIACASGYTVSGPGRVCQADGSWNGVPQTCVCPAGRFELNGVCRECPKGCSSCEACVPGSAGCLAAGVRCYGCKNGFSSDVLGQGLACCQGNVSCTAQHRYACGSGPVPSSLGDMCGPCREGYLQAGPDCIACPRGCRTCNAGSCYQCLDSYTMSNEGRCCVGLERCEQTGRPACVAHGGYCQASCLTGWYNDRGMCKQCPWMCQNCTGPQSCASCQAPYVLNAGMCCQDTCAAQGKGVCTSQGAPCQGCAVGNYTDAHDPTRCLTCPSSCANCTADGCSTCRAGYALSQGLCCNAGGASSCTAVGRLPCGAPGQSCGACLSGYSMQGGNCTCDLACLNGGRCGLTSDPLSETPFGACACMAGYTGPRCESPVYVTVQDVAGSVMLGQDRTVGLARRPSGELLLAGRLVTGAGVDVHGGLHTELGDLASIVSGIQNMAQVLQANVDAVQSLDGDD